MINLPLVQSVLRDGIQDVALDEKVFERARLRRADRAARESRE